MKRLIAGLVVTAAVAAPLAAVGPADAAVNRPCITRAEFRHIRTGMTLTQVRRIVGSSGRIDLDGGSGAYRLVVRTHQTCSAWHVSNVSYMGGRVSSKLYI